MTVRSRYKVTFYKGKKGNKKITKNKLNDQDCSFCNMYHQCDKWPRLAGLSTRVGCIRIRNGFYRYIKTFGLNLVQMYRLKNTVSLISVIYYVGRDF